MKFPAVSTLNVWDVTVLLPKVRALAVAVPIPSVPAVRVSMVCPAARESAPLLVILNTSVVSLTKERSLSAASDSINQVSALSSPSSASKARTASSPSWFWTSSVASGRLELMPTVPSFLMTNLLRPDEEAVNKGPTPLLSMTKAAKEVAPEIDAIEIVPPFMVFALTSSVPRRVELLVLVFSPNPPLFVITNLVVPDADAVKRSPEPELLTKKAGVETESASTVS